MRRETLPDALGLLWLNFTKAAELTWLILPLSATFANSTEAES